MSRNNWTVNQNYSAFLENYFVKVNEKDLKVSSPEEATIKVGLEIELIQYRKAKYTSLNIKAYQVFKNNQMDKIVASKPTSHEDLRRNCSFSYDQVQNVGDDIINIVKKYLIE